MHLACVQLPLSSQFCVSARFCDLHGSASVTTAFCLSCKTRHFQNKLPQRKTWQRITQEQCQVRPPTSTRILFESSCCGPRPPTSFFPQGLVLSSFSFSPRLMLATFDTCITNLTSQHHRNTNTHSHSSSVPGSSVYSLPLRFRTRIQQHLPQRVLAPDITVRVCICSFCFPTALSVYALPHGVGLPLWPCIV